MADAKKCLKCGNELGIDEDICDMCGAPYEAAKPKKKPAKKSKAKPE